MAETETAGWPVRWRWWLESVVLVVGAGWGITQLVGGAYNPAIELGIKSMERTGNRLVVNVSMKVASGRVEIRSAHVRHYVPGGLETPVEALCTQAIDLQRQGRRVFPAGDGADFGCVIQVPADECIGVQVELMGKRVVPSVVDWLWADSSWTTAGVTCSAATATEGKLGQ